MSTTILNPNPVLQSYYASLESRIGYRLFLGGTRHYGFYTSSTSSPFPINRALRAMEAELYKALQCPRGSRVLDAGCGVGHVALYMAKAGNYQVEGIDVVQRHVNRAIKNIQQAQMQTFITARVADYHHLEDFGDASFDGVYTMETLVHSTSPLAVLKEFLRILKPGGRIALNEYDHDDLERVPKHIANAMKNVNKYASMPANASFDRGVLKDLLEEAGFEDVRLRDISQHIIPMVWLFYIVGLIPYLIMCFFGLEHHFVNTMAAVESYRGRDMWRYVKITGRKKE